MTDDNTNTAEAQVAAQNTEAANANPGESAPSASATSVNPPQATALTGSTASAGLTGSGSDATTDAAKAESTFINDPASQQASLAGTSGKAPGTNDTGMATDVGTLKLTPAAAAQAGGNPGVDAPNVNVVAVGAPHPIVFTISTEVAKLKAIVEKQEKSPAIQRALKDLQTFEEWVIQHFEELKRKL